MLTADKASLEIPHPIGPRRQYCAVSVAAIGSLLPCVRPAGSCSPVATDGGPGMPCAGAARGPAGPGHGGGGPRSAAPGGGIRALREAVGLSGLWLPWGWAAIQRCSGAGSAGAGRRWGMLRVLWSRRCWSGRGRRWGLSLWGCTWGGKQRGECCWSGGAGMLRGRETRLLRGWMRWGCWRGQP